MSLNVIPDHVVHEQAKDMRDMDNPEAGKGFIMHNVRSFIQETAGGLLAWGRKRSLWPLTFGIKCCAIEMMAFGASRYDCHRMGVLFRASPRQSDLMIVAGPATIKLRDTIIRLYDQMPEPKYVIAFGECATCGGPFWDSYSVINGVDKLIPVDVYVPGCPPRPEQLLLAILKLQEKIDEKRKSKKTEVVGMPSMSREELLAQVMAHPTFKMGHQSGVPRFQPTPEELTRAYPTGQPDDYELVSPVQSKFAMEQVAAPPAQPAPTQAQPTQQPTAAPAQATPQPAPQPAQQPTSPPAATAPPTPQPAAAPAQATPTPQPPPQPAPQPAPEPAPQQQPPEIDELPDYVARHVSPDQQVKPTLPKWPK